jgi:hypothetical protein
VSCDQQRFSLIAPTKASIYLVDLIGTLMTRIGLIFADICVSRKGAKRDRAFTLLSCLHTQKVSDTKVYWYLFDRPPALSVFLSQVYFTQRRKEAKARRSKENICAYPFHPRHPCSYPICISRKGAKKQRKYLYISVSSALSVFLSYVFHAKGQRSKDAKKISVHIRCIRVIRVPILCISRKGPKKQRSKENICAHPLHPRHPCSYPPSYW